MAGFLWKPRSDSNGNLVVLTEPGMNGQISNVQIVGPDGQVLGTGNYTGIHNGNRGHWRFDKPGGGYPAGSRTVVNFDRGGGVYYDVKNPGGRAEGQSGFQFSNPDEIGQSNTVYGGGQPSDGNLDPGFSNGSNDVPLPPGAIGGGGSGVSSLPWYLQGFPQFDPVEWGDVTKAEYDFTDPIEFAKKFGDFNRGEFAKNFEQAQGFALSALETELKGLQGFAPAAAAVAREQIGIDNQFNQQQRTRQIDSVLPNARGDLEAQRRRAETYASGELPDAQLDRALELGLRSRAADTGTAAGFGAGSAQTRKVSDLMSADQRFQIAQYGEGLTTNNLATSSELLLAPTEYSTAGSQIKVTPEISAGRLAFQGAGMLNEATLVSPGQALTSEIQQNQFETNLEQRTNEINAEGNFRADTFNSTGSFQAAMAKFQYDVSYLNALQTSFQGNLNQAATIEQQLIADRAFREQQQNGQAAQNTTAGIGVIGQVGGAINAVSNIASSLGNLLSGSSPSTTTTTTTTTGVPEPSSVGGAGEVTPAPSTASTKLGAAQVSAPAPTQITGTDSSVPGGVKIAAGSPAPAGYVPVGKNSNGSTTVVPTQGYERELTRFSQMNGLPQSAISVPAAAAADRALSSTARLSFVPAQGFRPMAMTTSGSPIYASNQAMASQNTDAGAAVTTATMQSLTSLGVSDPAMLQTLSDLGGVASSQGFIGSLDQLASEKGPEAVGKAILNRMVDGKPDLKTQAGQQLAYGAGKIGELWDSMSGEQKSMALTSLIPAATLAKTGKNIGTEIIPGSAQAVGGPLTTGDVFSITAGGSNGFSLARNWGQLSAVSNVIASSLGVDLSSKPDSAAVLERLGFLGFGQQGSAVKVEPNYIEKVGGRPVPSMGVGAVEFNSPDHVPQNYKLLSQVPGQNKVIAVPGNLVGTNSFTGSPQAYRLAKQVQDRQHPAQRLWKGRGPSRGIVRGSVGGSAIVSAMSNLRQANPALLSSIASYSLFGSTLAGGGEVRDMMYIVGRDGPAPDRSVLQEIANG
jgi:hypothetical protein